MNARLRELWQQIAAFFVSQPPGRRVVILAVGVGSIAAVLGVAWWVQRPLYRPLFTNLSQPDAAAIVEALREERVPFRLEDGGRAVLVPAEKLYELRLALASRGLPEGGGVGFEIFDKQSLGQTDFLQRLNYQRALQGELGRTVAELGGVESARVHLALPERSLFVAEDRRPSASVVVKLAPGRTLSSGQIDGIVHLVAASVEGLATDDVTVVDEGGRMLTKNRRAEDADGTSSALEYQVGLERQLSERVETMLAAMVGRDKTIARVAATLDFARVERTEESYDPDRTAVRTQRTTREETIGTRGPGGAPGVQANLTNEAAAVPEGEGPRSERRDESQSFEISKVVSRTIAPPGVVKQLSVAVLIDGTYSTGEGGARTFTARPAEELDRLKELVKSAVGFSETRGDKIEIASVPFQTEAAAEPEGMLGALARWAPAVLTRLLGVVVAVVLLLFVVRPLLLGLAARGREVARATAELPPGAPRHALADATARLTQENLSIAQQDPERAARLVREWLHEGTPPAR
jgi:flagellar M-ring protein FliF